jgi:hypothetical protein
MEFSDAYRNDFLANWSRISQIRKPVIAAVSGYAVSLLPHSLYFSVVIILWTPGAVGRRL